MTEVHVRTYTEHHDTVRCYDPRRYTWRELPRRRTVADTQVVEFDDSEPVTPWEVRNGRERYQKERRAANIRRAYNLLCDHGPMTRKRLAQLMGVSLYTVAGICDAHGDVDIIARDGNRVIVGLPGQVYEPRSRYTATALRIADYLRERGALTTREVSTDLGINHRTTGQLLARYEGDLFDVAYTSATGAGGRDRKHWTLRRDT